MYNYQAPGQNGGPPGYGNYSGAPAGFAPGTGAPPSFGPPPGTASAPGVAPPPGLPQPGLLPNRPGGLPASFNPPVNMPADFNFNAPVIRLGMSGPGARPSGTNYDGGRGANNDSGGHRGRLGLGAGMDHQRGQQRDHAVNLTPPTREEIMRTIFVSNITEGISEVNLERILQAGSGGKLRRWTRAYDADNKACKFGFAEFEDAEGLETVAETLKDGVEVPLHRINARNAASNGEPKTNGESEVNGDPEAEVDKDNNKARLLVVVDEASAKYAAEWRERRAEDDSATQFRVDSAREDLGQVLASIFNPTVAGGDGDVDMTMHDADGRADPLTGEVLNIPINVEDELEDIPAHMRETVAAEIAAFRERSTLRDQQRLKREEEIELAERARNTAPRASRLATPPHEHSAGPAGANGIPVGPRAQSGIQGAPSGPKGYQGTQLPRDYRNGVSFVNGTAKGELFSYLGKEDEASDVDDEELEQRRRERKEAETTRQFLDYERRWLNREKSRTAAVEREKNRDKEESSVLEREREAMAKRLREWDDTVQAELKTEEYFQDRNLWLRNRSEFRAREIEMDNADRIAERREKEPSDRSRPDNASSYGDDSNAGVNIHPSRLAQQEHLSAPAPFKLSLGAAAAKVQQQAASTSRRKTATEVEGLLEDEKDDAEGTKRTLVPIEFDTLTAADIGRAMSDEERQQAVKQLAVEIPTEKDGLWSWKVQWDFLQDEVIAEQLRPYIEKQILSLLGVQEEMLVELIEGVVKKRGSPEELVSELEGALDEEAEGLVKKLWRMIIFFSESERRGLSN